jgi:predicted dinucleotide-binding enzyme
MKIAVIGTGMVGRAFAARLAGLGHNVVVGTRNVAATQARTEPDGKGIPPFVKWQKSYPEIRLVSFPDAGAHGDVVINATAGMQSIAALAAVGEAILAGKVIADLAVPLDYSEGRPPKLAFANTDSLGEQIQRAHPDAHVVKTLNTMHFEVMLDPTRVPGRHTVFVAGESAVAKATVRSLLGEFGWQDDVILDLGGIKAARATEMFVPLLFTLMGALGTADLNITVDHT